MASNYTTELKAIARTPITLVVISMDNCALTFAKSPCLASGKPCFNTYVTCRYKAGYQRQVGGKNYMSSLIVIPYPGGKNYQFSSCDAPLPFKAGEKPYIKGVAYLPTEIKDNLTVNARLVCTFIDEPDNDIGIDPYLFSTSIDQDFTQIRNVQYTATLGVIPSVTSPIPRGTFFKKFVARNPNYKGRFLKVYEGFLGLEEKDFKQKWAGVVDAIKYDRGNVKIEAVDLLKSLANIDIPQKLDIKLNSDITYNSTSFSVSTIEGLEKPVGYCRLDDEIIYYASIDERTKTVSGCVRGMFDTEATEHNINDKVQKVRVYAQKNPFDLLLEMLEKDAEISPEYIDYKAFEKWRDFPERDIDYHAVIPEPTKLEKLFFEIVDSLDCKCWVNEDLQITIKRNIQNEPGRTYYKITDTANIINDSAAIDLNPQSRISRILLYWDNDIFKKIDDVTAYSRLDIAVEGEAENRKEYGEIAEKKIFSRWIHDDIGWKEEDFKRYIKNHLIRQLWRYRDPMPILSFSLELKDSEMRTGEFCTVSTDEMCDISGVDVKAMPFNIIRREAKGAKINYKALQLQPRKIAFIAPDGLPDYDKASDADKEYGYISGNDGKMPDDSWGYFIF